MLIMKSSLFKTPFNKVLLKNTLFKNILPHYSFFIIIATVLLFTQSIRYAVSKFDITSIKNNLPFSLPISNNILILGFTAAFFVALFCKLINRYPLAFGVIFGGVLSNLLEKYLFDHVSDYIKITWGYINLADLTLWFGLILLNYEVWFNEIQVDTPVVHLNTKPEILTSIREVDDNIDINSTQQLTEYTPESSLAATIVDNSNQHSSKINQIKSTDKINPDNHTIEKLMPKVNKIRTVADQIKKKENVEFSLPKINPDQLTKKINKPKLIVSK